MLQTHGSHLKTVIVALVEWEEEAGEDEEAWATILHQQPEVACEFADEDKQTSRQGDTIMLTHHLVGENTIQRID